MDDRELCKKCQKTMVPRITFENNRPYRSFCPFCGVLHKKFQLLPMNKPDLTHAVFFGIAFSVGWVFVKAYRAIIFTVSFTYGLLAQLFKKSPKEDSK